MAAPGDQIDLAAVHPRALGENSPTVQA